MARCGRSSRTRTAPNPRRPPSRRDRQADDRSRRGPRKDGRGERGSRHVACDDRSPVPHAPHGLRPPPALVDEPRPVPRRDGRGRRQDVDGFAPGDEVYGTCDGSFAEYASGEPGCSPKPAGLSFEEAAAVPDLRGRRPPGRRDKAEVQPGQQVLVVGASGGVGYLRGPDRQGLRCRGHRGLQHRQGRPRPVPRRRPRRRLHGRRRHRRRTATT